MTGDAPLATRPQADKARAQHADDLARQGAHAVGVEPGKPFGAQGYVVVAYVDPGAKASLPASLACRVAGHDVDVPLVVRRAEMFKPE